MNLIHRIRDALRRPVQPVQAPPLPAKAAKGRSTVNLAETIQPLSEAELLSLCGDIFLDRMQTEEAMAQHSARRAELFEQGDLDAVNALDDQARQYETRLEYLNHNEPILHARIREIRAHERAARFAETRDRLLEKARATLPALRAAADATAPWRDMREAALAEFRGAEHYLPGVIVISHNEIDRFEDDIERFSASAMRPHPIPAFTSIADIIADARKTGIRPDDGTPGAYDVERALSPNVSVKMLRTWRSETGNTISPGVTISLSYERANQLVQSSFAEWSE